MENKKSKFKNSFELACTLVGMSIFVITSSVLADGMPDEPRRRPIPKPVYREEIPKADFKEAPPPRINQEARTEEECEWKVRLSPGMTVWFFDEEDNALPGPAAFLDVWKTDVPINFRVGVEGRHMYLGQEAANFAREWEDKTTRVTFIRIPFAVEYMQPVAKNSTLYLGGGPDIIHTANDLTDTNVGMHLGARLHYALNSRWGLAVEGGYMWADVDGDGPDVELDGAYVTPTLTYTF